MSDSSMGDSMFSYSQQRRYFGSAESCRFDYECRRCSFDGEKCSFSDNCRYECRNCDCSSSYFSSDFDDGNFSRKSSARMSNNSQVSYYDDTIDTKTSRYAEDFMKHVTNVKKSSIYPTMPLPHTNTGNGNSERTQKGKMAGGPFHETSSTKKKTQFEHGNSDYEALNKENAKQSSSAPRSPRKENIAPRKENIVVVDAGGNIPKAQPVSASPKDETGTIKKDDHDLKYYHNANKKSSLSSKSSNSSKSDSSANWATGTIRKSGNGANSKGDDLKNLSPYKVHSPNRQQQPRESTETGGGSGGGRSKTGHPGIIDSKMYIKKPEIVDAPKIGLPARDRSRAYFSTDTDDDNDEVFEDERRQEKTKVPMVSSITLYIRYSYYYLIYNIILYYIYP